MDVPPWSSKISLSIASLLTALNLAVTLRFWRDQFWYNFGQPLPAYSMDMTVLYCWIAGIMITPLALRAIIGTPTLHKTARRVLVALNVVALGSLLLHLLRHYF
ncbi:MAG TPA: hypothetical protein VNQ76_01795 [Planctomicrobium sp.]|nr:hypothetical protein [Planctomicrobium sp.]